MIEWRRDHAFDPSVGSSEEENYMALPSQAGMTDADVGTYGVLCRKSDEI